MAADSDEVYPVYHVLHALACLRGGQLAPIRYSDPLHVVAAMVRQPSRITLLIANLSPDLVNVLPPLPPDNTEVRWQRLDDDSARRAPRFPEEHIEPGAACLPPTEGALSLSPYSFVRLDWQVPSAGAVTRS
jgi:hypothetical protein